MWQRTATQTVDYWPGLNRSEVNIFATRYVTITSTGQLTGTLTTGDTIVAPVSETALVTWLSEWREPSIAEEVREMTRSSLALMAREGRAPVNPKVNRALQRRPHQQPKLRATR